MKKIVVIGQALMCVLFICQVSMANEEAVKIERQGELMPRQNPIVDNSSEIENKQDIYNAMRQIHIADIGQNVETFTLAPFTNFLTDHGVRSADANSSGDGWSAMYEINFEDWIVNEILSKDNQQKVSTYVTDFDSFFDLIEYRVLTNREFDTNNNITNQQILSYASPGGMFLGGQEVRSEGFHSSGVAYNQTVANYSDEAMSELYDLQTIENYDIGSNGDILKQIITKYASGGVNELGDITTDESSLSEYMMIDNVYRDALNVPASQRITYYDNLSDLTSFVTKWIDNTYWPVYRNVVLLNNPDRNGNEPESGAGSDIQSVPTERTGRVEIVTEDGNPATIEFLKDKEGRLFEARARIGESDFSLVRNSEGVEIIEDKKSVSGENENETKGDAKKYTATVGVGREKEIKDLSEAISISKAIAGDKGKSVGVISAKESLTKEEIDDFIKRVSSSGVIGKLEQMMNKLKDKSARNTELLEEIGSYYLEFQEKFNIKSSNYGEREPLNEEVQVVVAVENYVKSLKQKEAEGAALSQKEKEILEYYAVMRREAGPAIDEYMRSIRETRNIFNKLAEMFGAGASKVYLSVDEKRITVLIRLKKKLKEGKSVKERSSDDTSESDFAKERLSKI